MTSTVFRNGFFAFLAMILIAVAAALALNSPSEASYPRQAPAVANSGEDYIPADSDEPKVIDARIQSDANAG